MAYHYLINFGAHIRALRIQQKWAPAELARRLNITVEELYALERGENNGLTIVTASQVADMLHVGLWALLI